MISQSGKSQRRIARENGYSTAAISRYLSGERNLSETFIRLMSEEFGKSPEELVSGTDHEDRWSEMLAKGDRDASSEARWKRRVSELESHLREEVERTRQLSHFLHAERMKNAELTTKIIPYETIKSYQDLMEREQKKSAETIHRLTMEVVKLRAKVQCFEDGEELPEQIESAHAQEKEVDQ